MVSTTGRLQGHQGGDMDSNSILIGTPDPHRPTESCVQLVSPLETPG
jgi:hypothetical protein